MRLVRALAGALLWIVAAVVGLVGCVLCVTLVGLPLGIPLLMAARRAFTTSVRLMLPSHVAHPVKEAKSSARDATRKAGKRMDALTGRPPDLASASRRTRKAAGKKARKAKKLTKRARRKIR